MKRCLECNTELEGDHAIIFHNCPPPETDQARDIWDANKLVNTDHLTDDQWSILEDIFKDFK